MFNRGGRGLQRGRRDVNDQQRTDASSSAQRQAQGSPSPGAARGNRGGICRREESARNRKTETNQEEKVQGAYGGNAETSWKRGRGGHGRGRGLIKDNQRNQHVGHERPIDQRMYKRDEEVQGAWGGRAASNRGTRGREQHHSAFLRSKSCPPKQFYKQAEAKHSGLNLRHEQGRRLSRDGRGDGRKMGYKALEGLLEKEASEIAITLSSSLAFKALLDEKHMRNDLLQLVCFVLCKAFQSRIFRKNILHLAQTVKDSSFFRVVLPYYVTAMVSDYQQAKGDNLACFLLTKPLEHGVDLPGDFQSEESHTIKSGQYNQHLRNIIRLVSDVLNMFPTSSFVPASMLLNLLKSSINDLRANGVDILKSLDEDLERVDVLIKHLQEKSREGTLRSDKYSFLAVDEEVPVGEEDFRTMSIFPTFEEFHTDHRPLLRQNIVTQNFTSTRIYLDTHFRLLREDFVRPLRDGVKEILKSQHEEGGPMRKKQFDDIRVYINTQVLMPICTPTGIAYKVKFDPEPLRFVRWENSKRLLYGSLVCLSMDNFETFLFAMVCNREPNQLRKGWVDLCFFADGKANLASIRPSHSFLMVETTAYFEAYRYVLEGLQEQEEADLPFQRYIVECSTNVNSPSYLRVEGRTYNLSCIRAKGQKEVPPFNPLTPAAWPDEETMGLDESQLQALKLALTNELAIIQGPPGTGKTHVGLKIAQALLVNHEAWSHNSPMLVVCYTNHALDQFLEGIHSFLKQGIVRVGGRSNSEILKQFTLRQLTSSNEFRNKRPHPIRAAHHAIREEMDTAEETIKRLSLQLKCTLYGVLREEFLQRYISQQHWSSLSFQFVQSRSFLSEWLGLGNLTFQLWQQEPDEEDSAIAVEGTEEAEDLVDIVEEADLIQTERIVVDAEHQQKKTSEQQQRENEMWLEVSDMMLSMSTDENEKQHPVDPSQPAMTEGQWEIQHHQKKKMKDRVKKELKKSSVMSPKEEETIKDVRNLTMENKWRLYRLWVSRYQKYLREKMLNAEQVYQNSAERLNEIRWQDDLRVLRESRVVGMTTTGAAKFRKILQELKPRLVIVEEAAEVLEAHTITTLSRACQHLILIGDHQQLRPSATVYELARNFNLEVSMFERLVRVNFPFIRLNYQHRMRPSIARLLTPNIYENLENHPSVLEYENVKGLSTNLFFVNHSHFEQEIKDGRSHQNTHEAGFVVALCRYLLCQEYKPSQITILTTYTGQLHCLRKLMPLSEFSGVKVHVVDKYQGEENDIVILSLVRSNLLKKVGFLSISNRVCVALSRAKMGLYCIGNIDMLSSVTLWSKILYSLKEHGQAGPTLTLSCQNHPDKQTIVSCADDFQQAPEGGCDQPCLYRLECGHVCTRMCHPYDVDHKKFQCMKDCPKVLCDLKHKCPVRCYQECPKNCYVRLEKVIPFCLHKQQVPCYLNPEMFECQEPCQKILECGHPCKSVCGASCNSFNCQVKVPKQLKCGHLQEEPCFIALDPLSNPRCRSKCKTTLKCGHSCSGTCHKCCQGRLHQGCTYKCKQILVCSHNCTEPCVKDCPPCSFPCQNSCIHSSCKKACGQACTPCNEPCAWQCPHYSCTKLCHEPCDRPPCLVPCRNILPCKHQCIGLCGDPCPDKCRDCDASEVQEIFFGNEDESDARFIQLEDCRHIFESAGMDRYMSIDEEQNAELAQRAIRLKDCPRCRTPIRRNLRYGTHINRSLAAIEMVKNKISGVEPNIEEKQKVLRMQLYDNRILRDFLPKEFLSLKEKLQEKFTSSQQLWKLENLTAFLESVGKLKQIEVEQKINDHSEEFARFLQECLDFLFDSHQRFSDQQVADLDRELKRLSYLAELNVRCEKTSSESPELYPEVQELREILGNTLPFTEKHELKVKDIFVKLETKLPCSGLGITDEERIMIVKVIGLPKGHWYKCENGHVYAIGDCGGAMVQSKCPECNSVIGGQNHTLVQGNAVASEMDGAEHSAWSNAANLAIPHHNLF